jgi:hypothetical protein
MISYFASGQEMRSKKRTGTPPCEQWRGRVLVLVLVSCCVGEALAQQPFGIIVGTVTDPTGATLSAATVTVINTETQVIQNRSDQCYGRLFRILPCERDIHDKGGTPGPPSSGDKSRSGWQLTGVTRLSQQVLPSLRGR